MNSSLEDLAVIFYGKDYKSNPPGDDVPIYGTGGIMGYTSLRMNSGPAILTGRKGSINNPLFIEGDFWNVDTIFCVKAKDGIDPKWLFYNLRNKNLSLLNEATGVPSVSAGNLYRLKFNLFPLSQQRKTAKILTTCDEVIEETEAAISKYQALKQGMMHDLFTRGIDLKTGKLRPTFEVAPELYKKSELGMIPKEWEVKTFATLIIEGVMDKLQDGNHGEIHPKSSDFVAEGIPFVMASDITKGFIDLNKCAYISEKQYKSLRIGFSMAGDILLSHKASIGFVAQVPENIGSIMLTPQVTYYRVLNHKVLDNGFLKYYLSSHIFQIPLHNLAKQSTRDYIGITMQRELKMLFPNSLAEQCLISEKLNSIDIKIQTEQSTLSKYQQLKSGLMQDLLTGKVEVSLADEEMN